MAKGPKVPGETALQKTNAQIAADKYLDSRELDPMINDAIKRVSNYRSERAQARGASNIAAQSAMKSAPRTAPAGAIASQVLRDSSALGAQAAGTEGRVNDAQASTLASLATKSAGDESAAQGGLANAATQSVQDAQQRFARQSDAYNQKVAAGFGAAGLGASLAAMNFRPSAPSSVTQSGGNSIGGTYNANLASSATPTLGGGTSATGFVQAAPTVGEGLGLSDIYAPSFKF